MRAVHSTGRENRARVSVPALLFTAYVALLVMLMLPPLWAALLVLPEGRFPARLLRRCARFVIHASGCRLRVRGLDRLRDCGSVVVVANHASYLDSVMLIAALPAGYRFVANHRLASYPAFSLAIRKARFLIVDRTQEASRRACALAMIDTLRQGTSLFVFPEGTRHRGPGLHPFRLGAFRAAVEIGRPVVPITLTGTSGIWPHDTWVLHPGSVEVSIHAPIAPAGQGDAEVARLRDQARCEIGLGLPGAQS